MKRLMEKIIAKICTLYFNRYDLLVQCETDENNEILILFNDYIIEEDDDGDVE